MSKFIDADRLRAEIERRFWDYGTPLHDDEVTKKVNEVLSIIDSLQQEQPEVDLEKEIDRVSKRYPEVSFAKLSRIAVHFAKWKEAKDQEIIELAEEHAYLAGAVNEREKMMKEAVEYEVWDFSSSLEAYPHVNIPLDNKQYRSGDKVRIIIVKEGEK